jgi:hypothetical protein
VKYARSDFVTLETGFEFLFADNIETADHVQGAAAARRRALYIEMAYQYVFPVNIQDHAFF